MEILKIPNIPSLEKIKVDYLQMVIFEAKIAALKLWRVKDPLYSGVKLHAIVIDSDKLYDINLLIGDDDNIYFNEYRPEKEHDFDDFKRICDLVLCYLADKQMPVPYSKGDVSEKAIQRMLKEIREKSYEKERVLEFEKMIQNVYQIAVDDILSNTGEPIQLKMSLEKDYVTSGYIYLPLKYRLGADRLYVVRDIHQQIVQAIKEGQVLTLGKMTRPIKMLIENFDEASKFHLDFIMKYYDEEAMQIEKNRFIINWKNIDKFIHHYKDTSYFDIAEIEGNGTIKVLPSKDGLYCLKMSFFGLENQLIKLSGMILTKEQGHWLSYREISELDYDLLTKRWQWERMDFSKEHIFQLKEAIEEFSNIFDMEFEIDEVDPPAKPQIYIDMTDEAALLLKWVYPSKNKVQEALAYDMVRNFSAKQIGEHEFLIEKPIQIDNFLNQMMDELHRFGDVFISEIFKTMRRQSRIGLSVGVSVKKNTLQLAFDSSLVDLKELADILKAYHQKKKFYRLKSGERITLHERELDEFSQLLNDLDIDVRSLNKKPVPTYRMYQIQDLPSEFLTVDYDKTFETMFEAEPLPVVSKMPEILRPYQLEGIEWLLKLRAMNLGGILADQMGLGKSLQVIVYLMTVMAEQAGSHLIVAPASLLYNWEAEFKKFNFAHPVKVITGNPTDREALLAEIGKEKAVYVTSYDYLRRDHEAYADKHFDTIILDEAHYIKNKATRTAQIVKDLESDHRFALTGTPIENTLAELWSIFDFLMPGYLYQYSYFVKHFERPIIMDGDEVASKKLKSLVEPFILRRLKTDVLSELPDKIEETIYIGQTEREMQLYQANLATMQESLAEEMDLKASSVQVLAMLTKLRQLSLDPRLVYDNIYDRSSKIKVVVEMLVEAAQANEKVLVFSSFVTALELVEHALIEENVNYLKLTGATDKETRRDYVSEFQDENSDITAFLISLKAGGTGLNLTAASKIIHLDPWWNISAQNQATDRAHRFGQKSVVEVFKIVTKGTIEEKIEQLQKDKQEISDIFVENSGGSIKQLSEDEIRNLFS